MIQYRNRSTKHIVHLNIHIIFLNTLLVHSSQSKDLLLFPNSYNLIHQWKVNCQFGNENALHLSQSADFISRKTVTLVAYRFN